MDIEANEGFIRSGRNFIERSEAIDALKSKGWTDKSISSMLTTDEAIVRALKGEIPAPPPEPEAEKPVVQDEHPKRTSPGKTLVGVVNPKQMEPERQEPPKAEPCISGEKPSYHMRTNIEKINSIIKAAKALCEVDRDAAVELLSTHELTHTFAAIHPDCGICTGKLDKSILGGIIIAIETDPAGATYIFTTHGTLTVYSKEKNERLL